MTVREAWEKRKQLIAESNKLLDNSNKLSVMGCGLSGKTSAEYSEYTAKSEQLSADAHKLYAEGDLIFIQAVIEAYGQDEIIDWGWHSAIVHGIEYQ